MVINSMLDDGFVVKQIVVRDECINMNGVRFVDVMKEYVSVEYENSEIKFIPFNSIDYITIKPED